MTLAHFNIVRVIIITLVIVKSFSSLEISWCGQNNHLLIFSSPINSFIYLTLLTTLITAAVSLSVPPTPGESKLFHKVLCKVFPEVVDVNV